jgi:uncharacterized protein YqjF (DUF2071 family)
VLRRRWHDYTSLRRETGSPAADFVAEYQAVGPEFRAQPGTLDYWPTERYCLYAVDHAGRIYRGEIHHVPWPPQPAEAEIERNTMAPPGVMLPTGPTRLRFARALDVVAWAPTRMTPMTPDRLGEGGMRPDAPAVYCE